MNLIALLKLYEYRTLYAVVVQRQSFTLPSFIFDHFPPADRNIAQFLKGLGHEMNIFLTVCIIY